MDCYVGHAAKLLCGFFLGVFFGIMPASAEWVMYGVVVGENGTYQGFY